MSYNLLNAEQQAAWRARVVSVEAGGQRRGSPVVTVTCACKGDGLSICLCSVAVTDPARYAELVAESN
jgi:hypothetical protein